MLCIRFEYMGTENTTITFSLPESLKAKIEARITQGDFGNASEWFRTIARADLDTQQKLARLRALVQDGVVALDREEAVELTPELLADIKARGRVRLAEGDHA
jgi:antitoxin ParD1/3/4